MNLFLHGLNPYGSMEDSCNRLQRITYDQRTMAQKKPCV